MRPAPGDRLQRFVGDRLRFFIGYDGGSRPETGWRALLRTNIGRAHTLRRETVEAHARGVPLAGAAWRDLPMTPDENGWSLELPLAEVGFFKAKAYLVDPKGWQHWPEGPDVGVSVHPDRYRTANTLYCAFPRLFGPARSLVNARNEALENQIQQIESRGFTIIPPSGKLRDLIPLIPHITDVLGCRILHLLPVNPTPTTYARFGRMGSPYAALDLTAVDPALVVFDRRTTGIDQFRELTYAMHARGGRVMLDIVINHTGWGSVLQENHPEWFVRHAHGEFASPGAWGVTWEDLVELHHVNPELWDCLSDMFLTWCRRGVDGFRCDAGYMVPVRAWQYIIARVHQEYPETVFLLEGLGGSWEATEALLTEGGMQWAYSELFQNYSGREVSTYLDYALRQSERVGLYVHYSETHDNNRLAARGTAALPPDGRPDRRWSLLRNRLCALTSVSGGFGFTCGVEWLATEKIRVHDVTGLSWGNAENIVPELADLNALLREHPAFFDGPVLTRLSETDSPVYALLRVSAEGSDSVLVLVNTDPDREHSVRLPEKTGEVSLADMKHDLLGLALPASRIDGGRIEFRLGPGAAHCLARTERPVGLSGDEYRRKRAQAAWAVQALAAEVSTADIGGYDWRALAERVEQSPLQFLAAIRRLKRDSAQRDLVGALDAAMNSPGFPQVTRWTLLDARRITPVPPGHWLLLEDSSPFRASLQTEGETPVNVESIAAGKCHVACFAPRELPADARLRLERYADADRHVEAAIRFLSPTPALLPDVITQPRSDDLVLLTNGRGGMARIHVDLGRITSKYDCVLGANLHPDLPVDRHVFVKRIRAWVNADGFLSPLDAGNLASFEPGPKPVWHFIANAGDGRTVQIDMSAEMLPGKNTTVFRFSRPTAEAALGKQLPAEAEVRLTVRVDIEDRNFHWETHRNGGAEHHFSTHTHPLNADGRAGAPAGFAFTPAPDRQLRVFSDNGLYHPQPEWCENIPHPVEQSRGQVGSGDAFSPGWFELPLPKGGASTLTLTAEPDPELTPPRFSLESETVGDMFESRLARAARMFVVRRGRGKTVVAGYPWFLDWGRDTLICARGLLAAGMIEDVKSILLTFARFEHDGTLPNTIMGEDASNRDTSDAPLWFGIACEELADALARDRGGAAADAFYSTVVDESGRTLKGVLSSIATHYMEGTPNGIRVDPDSGLVWSPSHFTWMDTNHPAGTPREGYPVEIQALWIRLLRLLAALSSGSDAKCWRELADRALKSVESFFWLEAHGWYADVLLAPRGQPAAAATPGDALRSNCLFLVSLGLISGPRAQRCVDAASRYLLVPGAVRSLAPLPVSVPLPVIGRGGEPLNDPHHPYQPRYEGDEDTRRKPAYHNGTAWTWSLPVYCEALARAWEFAPEAVSAARACLASADRLINEGCLGHLPEVLDGDAPHTPRGCDAQSWSVTEALRVWNLLRGKGGTTHAPRATRNIQ